MYAMLCIKPNISGIVSVLSRYQGNLGPEAMDSSETHPQIFK